ncbi:hypothetical protein [Dankookia sp. P2]|uniref:hypothetical protein n=1 Tax=Dankookia sp. P2 TaxID=3423955 RepID=UPI003D67B0C6
MQLSNAEWIESLPGGDADKHFLQNCTNCHTLKQPLFSDHDAAGFVDVQLRMAGYAQASSLLRPQVLVQDRVANQSAAAQAARRKVFERQAAYLAQHNLRQKEGFDFKLTPFPARAAAPPAWWSPNTTCRRRRGSRTTSSSPPTAWSGTTPSPSRCWGGSTRGPARPRNGPSRR